MKLARSEEDFLKDLTARSKQYAAMSASGERSEEFVALEMLAAIASGFHGGLEPMTVISALASKGWREDTVPVPREFILAIAAAYIDYSFNHNGRTFGECLGIEGGGQGAAKEIKKQRTRDRNQGLANRVVKLLIWSDRKKLE